MTRPLPAPETFAPTYARAAIMRDAWAQVRDLHPAKVEMIGGLRAALADALRGAWACARQCERQRIEAAALAAMPCPEVDRLRAAQNLAHNLPWADARETLDRLAAAIREAVAAHVEAVREAARAVAKVRAVRRAAILAALPAHPVVTFIKADGTLRRMTLAPVPPQPVRVETAAQREGRAAAKAAANPHLLTVWDAAAAAFRSVNLDTLRTVETSGPCLHSGTPPGVRAA